MRYTINNFIPLNALVNNAPVSCVLNFIVRTQKSNVLSARDKSRNTDAQESGASKRGAITARKLVEVQRTGGDEEEDRSRLRIHRISCEYAICCNARVDFISEFAVTKRCGLNARSDKGVPTPAPSDHQKRAGTTSNGVTEEESSGDGEEEGTIQRADYETGKWWDRSIRRRHFGPVRVPRVWSRCSDAVFIAVSVQSLVARDSPMGHGSHADRSRKSKVPHTKAEEISFIDI
ncbi:hypothetical protein M427DRAFT_494635 [Gonapodya prolifera JEL478]|uniref:Uncharacterized protein n=1 Tax=Gonapodya prolifera (strain JEL478) TaxID=1344416 RepID=A0A139AJA4_GONPJ|nr:hypothetical protein M427DRAFT_494635 [Gonapodya prolifera JEL478]|eukprot:KXS16876.1 hypothetical protein M427DRAFT_494635 [Gonapodya prolifera JEL478]